MQYRCYIIIKSIVSDGVSPSPKEREGGGATGCTSLVFFVLWLYTRVHTSKLTEFVSASLWLNIFVPWSFPLSVDLRHVNDDSN